MTPGHAADSLAKASGGPQSALKRQMFATRLRNLCRDGAHHDALGLEGAQRSRLSMKRVAKLGPRLILVAERSEKGVEDWRGWAHRRCAK